ncbi:MAG: hypothetical protein CM1200mP4_2080 [Rhodospirillaceae bacterium]|nr:MAG: hypothetical protein CM1200mP4_2080 [Rhodospirillaceae bacterium]|tara:strand:- start:136 stop:528 length:393 start_codon:yes stop_codon:yes gene_type:complete
MSSPTRIFPSPPQSPETMEFWEAINEEKLLIPRCKDTGQFFWYPRKISPYTLSGNVEWVEASGKGVIYTYSVMRRADPQYVIAYVTLEEGITMMTNIVDCDPEALTIGQSVRLLMVKSDEGQKVPVFTPA